MLSPRRSSGLLVAVALAITLAGCTAGSSAAEPSSTCAAPPRPTSPAHGVLFGVNLDWGHEQLSTYAAQLGHHPAVAVSFTSFPFTRRIV